MKNYSDGYDDGFAQAEKIIGEKQERKIRFKKIRNTVLAVTTVAAMTAINIVAYKAGQKNPVKEESISTEIGIKPTCDIYTASPEVLNAWADYEISKFTDAAEVSNVPNSMYESYYLPVKDAYNNYDATKDERYKEQLQNNALLFEKELKSMKLGNYTFSSSPFIYSVLDGDMVLIPYTNDVSNGIIPNNVKPINFDDKQVLYIPSNTLNQDNNSFHM